VETTHVSQNEWINKQITACLYDGILISLKQKGTYDSIEKPSSMLINTYSNIGRLKELRLSRTSQT
jgi:hypothetical protein